MPRPRLIFIATILMFAGAAQLRAQRGGMGGGMGGGGGRRGGGSGFPSRGADAPKALNEDDLAKADPARVLLDKAKDLKLTDGQKQALDTIAKRYDWNTRLFAKQVDSLNTAMRTEILKRRGTASTTGSTTGGTTGGTTGSTSPDTTMSDAATATQRALKDAIQTIRDEFDADASTATEKLDAGQKSTAGPIIGDARSKLNDLLTAAGSVGGGRRGRGGPPPE